MYSEISVALMYSEIGFCCEWKACIVLFVFIYVCLYKEKVVIVIFVFHRMLLKIFLFKIWDVLTRHHWYFLITYLVFFGVKQGHFFRVKECRYQNSEDVSTSNLKVRGNWTPWPLIQKAPSCPQHVISTFRRQFLSLFKGQELFNPWPLIQKAPSCPQNIISTFRRQFLALFKGQG